MLYFNDDNIMENCSSIFNRKLKNIINKNIKNLTLNVNGKLSLERVTLDLGNIEIDLFEREITRRLEIELKKNLRNHYGYSQCILNKEKIYPHQSEKENRFLLIKEIDHYLHKGNWLSDHRKHHITNTVHINNELWQQINHQPQQWLPMLAKHCLQPAGLSRLIQLCQPDVLAMLCQLFTETTTSEFVNSQAQVITDKKVKPEKLSLAAEYYLQHQVKYPHATQQALAQQTQNKQTPTINIIQNNNSLLKQTYNETDMQMDTVLPFATYHQPTATQQHYGLIKEAVKQSLPTLQNREQHKELPRSTSPAKISSIQPSNGIQTPSSQSVLTISNAGCMILWPLLPIFFRTFDLLEKNQFISLEAQREAVCLLDWLIWEEEEIPAWRLTLNKILCGLPIHDNARWRTPKPEQQIAINQWLEKIIEQLPAWKKMGINDVRHLFLQRSGELSELNGIKNIHIKPEVYDALISEWAWPMNIASFSWLQHPITITWS